MKGYNRRLEKLEATAPKAFPDVLALIAEGKRYSDLTDAERERYAEYRGFPRKVLEEVEAAVFGGLDFGLQRRTPRPTPEELNQIIAEVETAVQTICGKDL